MHLGVPALLDFYRNHRDEESLVLATIIATEGSTYRKPGAMMLISRAGAFEGMISGGCLEGDLLHHAAKVFESGEAVFVTYDMHADEDLVWSLGLGCDGVIHLMLQRLDRVDDFGFLKQLEASHMARQPALVALVIQSAESLPCGAFALLDPTDISVGSSSAKAPQGRLSADWMTSATRAGCRAMCEASNCFKKPKSSTLSSRCSIRWMTPSQPRPRLQTRSSSACMS